MTALPSRLRALRALAMFSPAVLLLAACAAQPAQNEANSGSDRQAGSLRGLEACFTNSLSEPVYLATTSDGSKGGRREAGTRWTATLRPAATLCNRTENVYMSGETSPQSEPSGYSYVFKNELVGYPTASIIEGLYTGNDESGPGLCASPLAVFESEIYDSGTARFTVQRLEDSVDFKRFTVTVSPSEQVLVPDPEGWCLY